LEKQVIGKIAEALSGEMSNRLVDFEFPPRVVLALGPNHNTCKTPYPTTLKTALFISSLRLPHLSTI
jgi:hypothetical protein